MGIYVWVVFVFGKMISLVIFWKTNAKNHVIVRKRNEAKSSNILITRSRAVY